MTPPGGYTATSTIYELKRFNSQSGNTLHVQYILFVIIWLCYNTPQGSINQDTHKLLKSCRLTTIFIKA